MLTFLTSLRHPDTTDDYGQVDRLLAATLRSVCAQDDPTYQVLVVGNREPSFALPDRVEFVGVDFAPPAQSPRGTTTRERLLLDKGSKLAAGLATPAGRSTEHLMVFDADDFVSPRLAGFVRSQPASATGWVVERGYRWSESTGLIRAVNNFNGTCGTSLILNRTLFADPELSPSASQEEVIAGFGWPVVREWLGSHRYLRHRLDAEGTPLAPLPFRAVVYRVDVARSVSGSSMGVGRPVSGRLAKEFGLPRTSHEPQALARSAASVTHAAALRARRLLPQRAA